MTKRICFLLVGALVFLSMPLFAAGAKEAPSKAQPVTAAGEPQYGGTLTFTYWQCTQADPPSPDPKDDNNTAFRWAQWIQEKPLIGDFEKYGPRGSGEFAFTTQSFTPYQYLTGRLVDHWELTADKLTFHVRPGIQWAADNVKYMKNRELVAQDIVDDLEYFKQAPSAKFLRDGSNKIYAADKYTVVIELKGFDVTFLYFIGFNDRNLMHPPEEVAAGADKWENQVGTGPFMFKEYVVGSHMTLQKNPHWWKTTTINGKVYDHLPFIDTVVLPIIPDESTLVAAVRTGKVDYDYFSDSRNWGALDKVDGLLSKKHLGTDSYMIFMDVTKPPLDNLKLRRALSIGTDRDAFNDLLQGGKLPTLFYPALPNSVGVYTPLDQLPAESRQLYQYNPDLAKQMITDAGYPGGLKLDYYTEGAALPMDRAALLKAQWSKIGIDITIHSSDAVTNNKLIRSRTYKDLASGSYGSSDVVQNLLWSVGGGAYNWTGFSNKAFDEPYARARAEPNDAKRNPTLKDLNLYVISQVNTLAVSPALSGSYWWPWIKNYYGETNIGQFDVSPVLALSWIDQGLKKKMGF